MPQFKVKLTLTETVIIDAPSEDLLKRVFGENDIDSLEKGDQETALSIIEDCFGALHDPADWDLKARFEGPAKEGAETDFEIDDDGAPVEE